MILAAGRGERHAAADRYLSQAAAEGARPAADRLAHAQPGARRHHRDRHQPCPSRPHDRGGAGRRQPFGARIVYSAEGTALETAGGIANARHLLGDEPFVAVSGDIYCPHFDFEQVKDVLQDNDRLGQSAPARPARRRLAVPGEESAAHPQGDFALHSFSVANEGEPQLHLFRHRRLPAGDVRRHRAGRIRQARRRCCASTRTRRQVGGELYARRLDRRRHGRTAGRN